MSTSRDALVEGVLERLATLDAAPGRDGLHDLARRRMLDTALSWAASAQVGELAATVGVLARLHSGTGPGTWTCAGRLALLSATARWGEVDDIHLASCTTPGAAVCSTVSALATLVPETPVATGLEAVVAGYEVMAFAAGELGGADLLAAGVWPSRLVAPLASAAATAHLMSLDEAATRRALRLATLWRADARLPEPARALSFARAVVDGAEAALAAAAGADAGDAPPLPLWSGLHGRPRSSRRDSGQPAVRATSVKPFCGARQTLAGVAGVLDIVHEAGLTEEDIGLIAVAVPPPHVGMVDKHEIADRMDALTSMPCQVALALRRPDELSDVTRRPGLGPELKGLMAKVEVRGDDSLLDHFPEEWRASVSVVTRSGATFERRVRGACAHSGRPPTWAEVEGKGERLLARCGRSDLVAELAERARGASSVGDLGLLGSVASMDSTH